MYVLVIIYEVISMLVSNCGEIDQFNDDARQEQWQEIDDSQNCQTCI